jgi:hypothetical protein
MILNGFGFLPAIFLTLIVGRDGTSTAFVMKLCITPVIATW